MLHSAQNFAVGFFGYPIEGQYYESVTYETSGVCVYFRKCHQPFSLLSGDR